MEIILDLFNIRLKEILIFENIDSYFRLQILFNSLTIIDIDNLTILNRRIYELEINPNSLEELENTIDSIKFNYQISKLLEIEERNSNDNFISLLTTKFY